VNLRSLPARQIERIVTKLEWFLPALVRRVLISEGGIRSNQIAAAAKPRPHIGSDIDRGGDKLVSFRLGMETHKSNLACEPGARTGHCAGNPAKLYN
jgi:hypothetical protein